MSSLDPATIASKIQKTEETVELLLSQNNVKDARKLEQLNKELRFYYSLMGLEPEIRKAEIDNQIEENERRLSTSAARLVNRRLTSERQTIERTEQLNKGFDAFIGKIPLYVALIFTVLAVPSLLLLSTKDRSAIEFFVLVPIMWVLCFVMYKLSK